MDSHSEKKYLDAVDYIVFIGMLVISSFLGVYFAFINKKKPNTTSEFLVGSKELSIFPIAMSLASSYVSPINFLGGPAEVYMYGSQILLRVVPNMVSVILVIYFLMPVFYSLNLLSSYEYLTIRFNQKIGMLSTVLFLINMLIQSAVVIYTPAITLAQLTGFSLKILIPLLAIFCIFYTSVGGLRAVVWADTFQMFLMLVGALILNILGTYNVGSFQSVWERNKNSGRIEFFNMDPDPRTRTSFWTVIIGLSVITAGHDCTSQMVVQRCLSLSSFQKSKRTAWLFALMLGIIGVMNGYNGLVTFANFYNCDPLITNKISKIDQIVPYLWMLLTQKIPVLPGIFVSAIFSASFSTISTNLNSMAGVFVINIVKPLWKKPISERNQTLLMRILVVIIGCLVVALAFIIDNLGTIFQMTVTLVGITIGPLFGIFLLGMFFPKANAKGAFVGVLISFAFLSWMAIGAQIAISHKQIIHPKKSFTIEGCDNSTLQRYYSSSNFNKTEISQTLDQSEPFPLYRVSFQYYTLIGVVISLLVGSIVSYFTGGNDKMRENLNLYAPIVRKYIKADCKEAEEMKLHNVE